MTSTSPHPDVASTRDDAARMAKAPLLILDAVREFFDACRLGEGEVTWQRIGAGQSNITYRIERGGEVFVLRRGPRPPHPRSTHDMVREARVQQILRREGVAVPEVLAVCDDPRVLGVSFYVMRFIEGEVLTDSIPPALSSFPERRATAFAAVDTLVRLHTVDASRGPVASLGRPENYLLRQVQLFQSLWHQNAQRELPEVDHLAQWLSQNLPESELGTVVHGDFRIGNLMYAADAPARVIAILDWEMATLGDPLADLGYLTATYATQGSALTPMELTSVTREPGYPSRDELVDRYCAQLQLNVDALPWYQALALWKAAIFCEALYTRWLNGEREGDAFAPTLRDGIPQLFACAADSASLLRPR